MATQRFSNSIAAGVTQKITGITNMSIVGGVCVGFFRIELVEASSGKSVPVASTTEATGHFEVRMVGTELWLTNIGSTPGSATVVEA